MWAILGALAWPAASCLPAGPRGVGHSPAPGVRHTPSTQRPSKRRPALHQQLRPASGSCALHQASQASAVSLLHGVTPRHRRAASTADCWTAARPSAATPTAVRPPPPQPSSSPRTPASALAGPPRPWHGAPAAARARPSTPSPPAPPRLPPAAAAAAADRRPVPTMLKLPAALAAPRARPAAPAPPKPGSPRPAAARATAARWARPTPPPTRWWPPGRWTPASWVASAVAAAGQLLLPARHAAQSLPRTLQSIRGGGVERCGGAALSAGRARSARLVVAPPQHVRWAAGWEGLRSAPCRRGVQHQHCWGGRAQPTCRRHVDELLRQDIQRRSLRWARGVGYRFGDRCMWQGCCRGGGRPGMGAGVRPPCRGAPLRMRRARQGPAHWLRPCSQRPPSCTGCWLPGCWRAGRWWQRPLPPARPTLAAR